jgi:NADPH:quinone reductase-like Zn-dependent oxidoreductase
VGGRRGDEGAAPSAGWSPRARPELPEGSLVLTDAAWRETAVLDAAAVTRLPAAGDVAPSWYLGVLGMPGLTAYAGLFRVGAFREGDDVFVSGAAGAVGSLVTQFARLRGAGSVVGSAGSPEKVAWLRELGCTAAFDHHDGVARGLAEAAPTASTCSSTTSAGSTWRPRSARSGCTGGPRCAARSPATTPSSRRPGRATWA